MFKLAPKLIFIIQVIIQLYLNNHHAILTGRMSFCFLHLFITEYVVFQRLGHLLFHFRSSSSRIHSGNNSLPDRKIGKLILFHLGQSVDSKCHQTAGNQNNNLPVMHRPLNDATLLCLHFLFHFSVVIRVCTLTFCCPSTITSSPETSPFLITTPRSVSSPVCTILFSALPCVFTHTNERLFSSS